jgi:hypothetical protein
MTSFRQIESNRRNALKSTGPRTESGKQRSSQNAVRHGLTAETVIKLLEDPEDYQAFELAVTADYDAETAVERELVLRLASLLWRLRRATSIEAGLLQIQGEILHERRVTRQTQGLSHDREAMTVLQLGQSAGIESDNEGSEDSDVLDGIRSKVDSGTASQSVDVEPDVARCFLRLANLDGGVFERLGRYEATLWRQARQTIFTLESLRWRVSSGRHPRRQHPWHRSDAYHNSACPA